MRGQRTPLEVGARFGRMTIVSNIPGPGVSRCECLCSCGNTVVTRVSYIKHGNKRSCGCLQSGYVEVGGKWQRSGSYGGSERKSWNGMHARCNNPKNKDFKHYGARGITVCERWKLFDNFLADMGRKPSPSHSIERRDNNAGYGPDNCYWATSKEQSRNKRSNRFLTVNGVRLTVFEWSVKIGLSAKTIRTRLSRGWTAEEALAAPAGTTRQQILDARKAGETQPCQISTSTSTCMNTLIQPQPQH